MSFWQFMSSQNIEDKISTSSRVSWQTYFAPKGAKQAFLLPSLLYLPPCLVQQTGRASPWSARLDKWHQTGESEIWQGQSLVISQRSPYKGLQVLNGMINLGSFFLPLLFIDWRLHRRRPLMFYFNVWALLHGWWTEYCKLIGLLDTIG